jgi:hypothetical protein
LLIRPNFDYENGKKEMGKIPTQSIAKITEEWNENESNELEQFPNEIEGKRRRPKAKLTDKY